MTCTHATIRCLNQYETIRKYACQECEHTMMCSCDEEFGRAFLPHQLTHGTDARTSEERPVTLGFQPGACNECRGLPPQPSPLAAGFGRTSNIRRYYWRELSMETTRRFAKWAGHAGLDRQTAHHEHPTEYRRIEEGVLAELKALHASAPKYSYMRDTSNDVIARYAVEVVPLKATFLKVTQGKALLVYGNDTVTAEEYVARHYRGLGYDVTPMESRSWHALFAIFMWLLIEGPDEQNRMVGFGSRTAFDAHRTREMIWTMLPRDFGAPGYGTRRTAAIATHLKQLPKTSGEWEWTFDYWLPYSTNLREYLWAHRPEDHERARLLMRTIPEEQLKAALQYLVESYWERYLGWPDLLIHRKGEYFLAEVKASRDQLSEEQKTWVAGNANVLRLPFKIIKLHRATVRQGRGHRQVNEES